MVFGDKDRPMNKELFYKSVRETVLGPKLEQNEIDGCEAILAAMEGALLSHCAYALATAYHETARTMKPVREAYWLSEGWRKANLRYWPWYGRGYVQITWKRNYEKADHELDLGGTLIANADRAMELDIAAKIMRRGMDEGWFTNRKLSQHLPRAIATGPEFEGARRIINGTDKARTIMVYALQFQSALQAGGWQ
jgi:putative chitinase